MNLCERHYSNPELSEISQGVLSGKYADLEEKLLVYLKKNLPSIEREKISWEKRIKKSVTPTFAAKQFILKTKSVDLNAELTSQRDEILREAWYRGDSDHNRVASEWAKKYAGGWRDHYVLTLALILDAREKEFLDLYRQKDVRNER